MQEHGEEAAQWSSEALNVSEEEKDTFTFREEDTFNFLIHGKDNGKYCSWIAAGRF